MSIAAVVKRLHRAAEPAMLATLIATEGHSYRKAGAVMLFQGEESVGTLSPGCLESDLKLRLPALWASGLPETVEYNMTSPDDFSWGEATGCGGKIRIVLEPVSGTLRELLLEAGEALEAGKSATLLRTRSGRGYSYRLDVSEPGGEAERPLRGRLDEERFATVFEPEPRLVLFGAGHDAGPIAELAVRSGFRLAVADWREGSLQSPFPAEQRIICPPREAARRLDIGPGDYVLICSHQFQRDREFLERLLPLEPAYIGIIGSQARIGLLTEGLPVPSSLHAPAGLAIGSEGPEEIAVSIAAELIAVRRRNGRRTGGRLRAAQM
ncbi:XdhC family protein [Paenibacillus glufosinatiresistens]|uniref:XdhC family protein n=1 Tax=Paenibacillus glufosinatiresistens TaxID=3070657 RepID=UPI00286DE480|nr:XdhC family protein [Paenibacillus sp. YX.27]